MAVITLTTDFGLDDEYVGVMKGAILKVNPHVQLVDISHQVPPFDVLAAARMVQAAYSYFPEGTVHMVVVDPGVGSSRAIVAFDMDNHRFIVPDNGIPAFLIRRRAVDGMVGIPVPMDVFAKPSDTFHGRDVFAPAAARLAQGCALTNLGPEREPFSLIQARVVSHGIDPNGTVASGIAGIDRFGNLITDVSYRTLKALFGDVPDDRVEARIGTEVVRGVNHHYGQAGLADPVMVVGSRGYLEIAVNQGSAKERFHVERGDKVVFSVYGHHTKRTKEKD